MSEAVSMLIGLVLGMGIAGWIARTIDRAEVGVEDETGYHRVGPSAYEVRHHDRAIRLAEFSPDNNIVRIAPRPRKAKKLG